MKVNVYVTLKEGVLDPQGKAIKEALHSLQYRSVQSVRQGKYFELELSESSKEKVQTIVRDVCEKLLANTVIENYHFDIEE